MISNVLSVSSSYFTIEKKNIVIYISILCLFMLKTLEGTARILLLSADCTMYISLLCLSIVEEIEPN